MLLKFLPALARGRFYAFPVAWTAVFAAGLSWHVPQPNVDDSAFLSFAPGSAQAATPTQSMFFALATQPPSLTFVRHDHEADEAVQTGTREASGGHGRFAAPGNAVRRQVQLRAINPRTADELAGFFREASYTLTDVRQGEA